MKEVYIYFSVNKLKTNEGHTPTEILFCDGWKSVYSKNNRRLSFIGFCVLSTQRVYDLKDHQTHNNQQQQNNYILMSFRPFSVRQHQNK